MINIKKAREFLDELENIELPVMSAYGVPWVFEKINRISPEQCKEYLRKILADDDIIETLKTSLDNFEHPITASAYAASPMPASVATYYKIHEITVDNIHYWQILILDQYGDTIGPSGPGRLYRMEAVRDGKQTGLPESK